MILDADELIRGYPFLARRYDRVAHCDPAAVHAAMQHAAELANNDPAAEPTAVFFALASRRRAFPFAWRLMSGVGAMAQARRNGRELHTNAVELAALCEDVLHGRTTWQNVQTWFASRLR